MLNDSGIGYEYETIDSRAIIQMKGSNEMADEEQEDDLDEHEQDHDYDDEEEIPQENAERPGNSKKGMGG